ncbi:MAG: peptidase serine carboxypeptidase [Bryobacterales bacterium]|nr:peptidase serine carboxypeptidase [Bryobacterales bacterium]
MTRTALAILLAATSLCAQTPPKPPETPKADEKPVVTNHQIQFGGKPLKYTATTGLMPIKNNAGETEAEMFFVAYTRDDAGPANKRPLMLIFNGGPGAASVWLHLGAVGPRVVKMLENGAMPAPPFQLVDNQNTWLDQADLVFIDPVGTGYSRPSKPELGKKFWGVQEDLRSVGEFIRLYLTRYERWGSPLFLAGESYGTTRAAGLSGYLIEHGIAFNGIVLMSTVLNFQTLLFTKGNDLPYDLFLPTYTATAWYHHKLAPDLQKDLKATLREVEQWAGTEYLEALAKGNRLTAAERQQVIDKLARYTGLDKKFIDDSDLRIEIFHFTKELLRDRKQTVGRIDSRFTGIDESGVSDRPDYDSSIAVIRPPYTAAFNQYVRAELGYKSDLEYYVLGGGLEGWNWGQSSHGFADTSDALRSAFAKNPYMKLFVAMGYFDLATPYFATEYTLSHLGIQPAAQKRITVADYMAGHMMYIDGPSHAKLKRDVTEFVEGAVK